jgi:hypothetical protein
MITTSHEFTSGFLGGQGKTNFLFKDIQREKEICEIEIIMYLIDSV